MARHVHRHVGCGRIQDVHTLTGGQKHAAMGCVDMAFIDNLFAHQHHLATVRRRDLAPVENRTAKQAMVESQSARQKMLI